MRVYVDWMDDAHQRGDHIWAWWMREKEREELVV
jgi:hypothetical protein